MLRHASKIALLFFLLLPAGAAQAQGVDTLLVQLRDVPPGDPDAGEALALRFVRAEGLAPLVEVLRTDGDPARRQVAARALGLVGDEHGVETRQALAPLVEALQDTSEGVAVRAEAALALGYAGDEQVIAPLVEALRRDASADVRVAAARALGFIGEPPATAPLREAAAEDPDARVRQAAVQALTLI